VFFIDRCRLSIFRMPPLGHHHLAVLHDRHG
jgi:hypothetical protein